MLPRRKFLKIVWNGARDGENINVRQRGVSPYTPSTRPCELQNLEYFAEKLIFCTRCRAGNGSLRVTHDPSDPLSSWPMTHVTHDPWVTGAVIPYYRKPYTYLSTTRHCIWTLYMYTHLNLSCYIIAHVSKLHTQAPVNFFYKEINKIK